MSRGESAGRPPGVEATDGWCSMGETDDVMRSRNHLRAAPDERDGTRALTVA